MATSKSFDSGHCRSQVFRESYTSGEDNEMRGFRSLLRRDDKIAFGKYQGYLENLQRENRERKREMGIPSLELMKSVAEVDRSKILKRIERNCGRMYPNFKISDMIDRRKVSPSLLGEALKRRNADLGSPMKITQNLTFVLRKIGLKISPPRGLKAAEPAENAYFIPKPPPPPPKEELPRPPTPQNKAVRVDSTSREPRRVQLLIQPTLFTLTKKSVVAPSETTPVPNLRASQQSIVTTNGKQLESEPHSVGVVLMARRGSAISVMPVEVDASGPLQARKRAATQQSDIQEKNTARTRKEELEKILNVIFGE